MIVWVDRFDQLYGDPIMDECYGFLVPIAGLFTATGLMQLFCYHIAHVLGRPIDKPRNLAKSVTVE